MKLLKAQKKIFVNNSRTFKIFISLKIGPKSPNFPENSIVLYRTLTLLLASSLPLPLLIHH